MKGGAALLVLAALAVSALAADGDVPEPAATPSRTPSPAATESRTQTPPVTSSPTPTPPATATPTPTAAATSTSSPSVTPAPSPTGTSTVTPTSSPSGTPRTHSPTPTTGAPPPRATGPCAAGEVRAVFDTDAGGDVPTCVPASCAALTPLGAATVHRPHLVTALFAATNACEGARHFPLGALSPADFRVVHNGRPVGGPLGEDTYVVHPVAASVAQFTLLVLDWSASVSDDEATRAHVADAVAEFARAVAASAAWSAAPRTHSVAVATFAGDASRLDLVLPWTTDEGELAAFASSVDALPRPALAGTALFAAVRHGVAAVDAAVSAAARRGLAQGSLVLFTDDYESVHVVTFGAAEAALAGTQASFYLVRVGDGSDGAGAATGETAALAALASAAPRGALLAAAGLSDLGPQLAAAVYLERGRNRGAYAVTVCTAAQGDAGVAPAPGATAGAPHVVAVTLAAGAGGGTLLVPFSAAGFSGARCAAADAPGGELRNVTARSVCASLRCGAYGAARDGVGVRARDAYVCPCGDAEDNPTLSAPIIAAIVVSSVVGTVLMCGALGWRLRVIRRRWMRLETKDVEDTL